MSLYELREIAKRQQEYIGTQQKLILSIEAKLKHLKETSVSSKINDQQMKVNKLRDTVNIQETRLRQLKALRGQVKQINNNNHGTLAELESIHALFNEKEKELAVSLAKVDALTRQLEDLKNGVNHYQLNNIVNSKFSTELNKLKQELLHRNNLNEKQNSELLERKKLLGQRKSEISSIDERIQELQQRLTKKRILNQQLSSQMQSNLSKSTYRCINGSISNPFYKNSLGAYHTLKLSRPINMNIATVEPLRRHQQPMNTDTKQAKETKNNSNNMTDFKQHYKYETLPYNTKFDSKFSPSKESYSVLQSNNIQEKDHLLYKDELKINLTNKLSSDFQDFDNGKENIDQNILDSGTQPFSAEDKISSDQVTFVSLPNKSVMEKVSLFSQKYENSKHLSSFKPNPNISKPQNNSNTIFLNENKQVPNSEEMIDPQSISVKVPSVHKASIKSFIKPNKPLFTSSSNLNENLHSLSKISSPLKPIPPPRLTSNNLSNHSNSLSSSSTNIEKKNENTSLFSTNEYKSSEFTSSSYKNNQTHNSPLTSSIYSNQSYINYNLIHQKDSSVISSPSQTYSNLTETLPSINLNTSNENSNDYDNSCFTSTFEEEHLTSDEIWNRLNKETFHGYSSLDEVDRSQPYHSETSFLNLQSQDIFSNSVESNSKKDTHKIKRRPVVCDAFEKQLSNNGHEALNCSQDENKIKESENDISDTNKGIQLPFLSESPSLLSSSNYVEENLYSFEPIINDSKKNDIEFQSVKIEKDHEDLNEDELQSNQKIKISRTKSNLKNEKKPKDKNEVIRRVSFDPLALLLDAALEGELELVKKVASEVPNPSAPNDEGITALHNTICAGHFDVVKYLVEIGCDVNAPDSDGWTPLHCAASCNNLTMVKFLVENGACIFATTLSDRETAAEKCEEGEEGFDGCSQYLYNLQEELGLINGGKIYSVYNYQAQSPDELSFEEGESMIVLRRGDDLEKDWWWAKLNDKEGYIPRNLVGLYPRHKTSIENKNSK